MNNIAHSPDNSYEAPPREFVAWALRWRANGYPPLVLGGNDGKKLLVKGITGFSPDDATDADIRQWPRRFAHVGEVNLGIRCPVGVLGIDVDAYDGKRGLTTLTELEAQWGPLPPTWITTPRSDGSGHRWYRVGVGWRGHDPKAADGSVGHVELIQRHHRYAAVPPSEHHTGADYRLYDPDGHEDTSGLLPAPDQLPWLPQEWLDGLAQRETATRAVRGRVEVAAWLDEWTGDDYAHGLSQAKTRFHRLVNTGKKDRHKAMADVLALACKESRAGGYPARKAESELRAVWLEAIDGDSGHDEAAFDEMLSWAIDIAEADDHDQRWLIMRRDYGARHDAPGNLADLTKQLADLNKHLIGDDKREMAAMLDFPKDRESQDDSPGHGGSEKDSEEITALVSKLRIQEIARERLAAERAHERLMVNAERAMDGLAFLTDDANAPPLWGRNHQVLWAPGEGLMICGPQGVGKSTVAQQLLLARLGLLPDLFGFPVAVDDRPVLYLAMDRPPQIRRSLARMVDLTNPSMTATLERQLVIWRGPLPFDAAQAPEIFAKWVAMHGRSPGLVIVDSLKDLASGLAKDDVGAGVNAAMQQVLADGTEFVSLHHQRKAGPVNPKPDTLSDVYGNSWLTAGMGSVLLLWGEPGGAVIELSHLKQPQDKVGPLIVNHTHPAGQSAAADPVERLKEIARLAGADGFTLVAAVRDLYGVGKGDDGWLSAKGKTMRRLDKLTDDGFLLYTKGLPGGAGGGGKPAKWAYALGIG